MTYGENIRSILDGLREYIEDVSGYATFSERMPSSPDDIVVMIYYDDKNPFEIDDNKLVRLNLIATLRMRLNERTTNYIESDAQAKGFDLLSQLMGGNIPGGHLVFLKSDGGYEVDSKGQPNGCYLISLHFQLI